MQMRPVLLSITLLLAVSPPAWATLGERLDVSPTKLPLQVRLIRGPHFVVREAVHPTRVVVKEFAAPGDTGQIFAVTWTGPFKPDLRRLLGRHWDRFLAGARENRHGHAHLFIHSPDLVIESSGHLRAFRGRAYLPALLPQGVSLDEIR